MQQLAAAEAPRRFACLAVVAAAPDGAISRDDLRRLALPDAQPDAARQMVHRLVESGWLVANRATVALAHEVAVPARPRRFLYRLAHEPPGEFLPSASWIDALSPAFRAWWTAWRTTACDVVVDALTTWLRAELNKPEFADLARPAIAHVERWRPQHADLEGLRRRVYGAARDREFRWPTVNRPDVNDVTTEHLLTVPGGGPCVAVLSGDAGVGKSTAIAQILAHQAVVSTAPNILRVAGAWKPDEEAANAWASTATRTRLVEALLQVPGVPQTPDGRWLAHALQGIHEASMQRDEVAWIEAVRGAWIAVLEQHPEHTWLVVDDLQWVDNSTQHLILSMLAVETSHRWRCLVASRAALPSAWKELRARRPERWRELALGGLPNAAIPSVVLHTEALPELVAEAFQYADGHAFRWRELVRRALTQGEMPRHQSLTELLVQEAQSWTETELTAAGAVLLLGDAATVELVARIVEQPPSTVETILRPLRQHGIIAPPPETRSTRIWIAADRWRDAILAALPRHRRDDLHRRVAATLEAFPLLRDRLDIRLAITDHERQGGLLSAAADRIPDVAEAAVAQGQTDTAHALWTQVLTDVYAAFGEIPPALRERWATYALRHQIKVPPLPRASSSRPTHVEQLLQLTQQMSSEEALDQILEIATTQPLPDDIRTFAIQMSVVANEHLAPGRGVRRRQRMLARRDELLRHNESSIVLALWFAVFAEDWATLEALLADTQDHGPTQILGMLSCYRLVGWNRRAWEFGVEKLRDKNVPAYIRGNILVALVSVADMLGATTAITTLMTAVTTITRDRRILGLPDLVRIGRQAMFQAVASGAMRWDAMIDQELATTWMELREGAQHLSNTRLGTYCSAAYMLAERGQTDAARNWTERLARVVSTSEILDFSSGGAMNLPWRWMVTAARIGDIEGLRKMRRQLRTYPLLRAHAMREPTLLPQALAAYMGCGVHELWGAEDLRPVRTFDEAMAIARAAGTQLPPLELRADAAALVPLLAPNPGSTLA
ncbi:MAG: AAA family ATPase [Gemmatimonadaceae bacterium]|nr:AAA family ATPase [Gemmatimonadaceae bacterium]